jgi:oligosaccharide repeat unit polymerase
MIKQKSSRVLDNIVSPYGLALFSYVFFLFACLIPPSFYTHYMNEPDLMFLDPATILFYTLCVVSFILGVWLIGWMFPSQFIERRLVTKISPTAFLLLPLFLGITVIAVSMFLLVKQIPNIALLLLSQHGGELKEALAYDVEQTFGFAPLLLIAITWWAFSRSFNLNITGWKRRMISVTLIISVIALIIASVLTMSRTSLMPLGSGLAILELARRIATKQANTKFILKSSFVLFLCLALLFFGFSFLRGTDNWDDQINSLLGYTMASYNRLSAVVNGRLHYPFGGLGCYLSIFATHNPLVRFIKSFNIPDVLVIWASEFSAVSKAGLDGNLIWSGSFGYIFSDIGWFSLPFVFGYGLLYGVVWKWFKSGKVLGIVLYPWFGFCILFWFGSNYLLDAPLKTFLETSFLLAGYERLFLKQSARVASKVNFNLERPQNIFLNQPPFVSN